MQKALFIKLSIIAGLCLVFAVGLGMFSTVIYERQHYADTVVNEIAKQHVNPQEVITPFIVIPTTITPACTANEFGIKSKCKSSYTKLITLLAQQTTANEDITVSTDTYQRGVYHAISYNGDLTFDQQYQLNSISVLQQPAFTELTRSTPSSSTQSSTLLASTPITEDEAQQVFHWDEARLIMPVSDLRGVASLPTVIIDGKNIKATYPQVALIQELSYVEAALPQSLLTKMQALVTSNTVNTVNTVVTADTQASDLAANNNMSAATSPKKIPTIKITTNLPLSGISTLNTVPTGNNFEMNMTSNWHSPNFIGHALPNSKNLDKDRFDAKWQNQYLTLSNNQYLESCLGLVIGQCRIDSSAQLGTAEVVDVFARTPTTTANLGNTRLSHFGVSFAEPNDVYLQTERTMKYALLLILVSFGTFFLFEIIKASRIHPIQYLLVGSALLVFYVLLLPLAEQIAFWKAYTIAAAACVGLIGWYSYYVLGNVKRAVIFTAILSGLYAAFYGILTTEDMNLLLGAVFCFVLLASVMVMTRKIDWYKVA